MRCLLLEKVPIKWPHKRGRVVWGVILGRSRGDGTCLVYVRKPQADVESILVAAIENPQERCFEVAHRFNLSLGQNDLCEIGAALKALGEEENDADVRRLFDREDLF